MMKYCRLGLVFIILFTMAPIVFPQDDVAHARRYYERGRKLYRAGHTDRAIEELYTALSVQEIFFNAQLLLGRSLVETRRYREAVATLREIESPDRDTAEVQKLLGKAYYGMNKLREASQKLRYASDISKRPDYELHYLLGLVKLRQEDAQSAILEAQTAVALKPRSAPAHKLLSDAYLMKKDYKQAEEALVRCLRNVRDPAEARGLKERIGIIKSLGKAKPEEAIQKPVSPPRIHKIPQPNYTDEARRYRVEGEIRVETLFGSNGVVLQALVTRGLGFGLDEEALKAAQAIEFKPGEIDGQPASMWAGVKILFTIADGKRKPKEDSRIALITEAKLRTGIRPAAR